ncbi:flagellar export protein FliJ [Planococcus salinus]|uniref:Flagellar FliJ protein n=1 Tax=Planococcus salinus TaxID=1848460 RepID=A0A3M8P505_9BACL|nr:flagellar export protein FliJ [Planococcus salinus]RNF38753.1 flagellar export protein FliJ [Planococcus salinus]
MTPFDFRFQKILDLKENEKDVAQIQMADAIKQQEEGHRRNEAIYHKISDAERLQEEKQQKGVPIAELRMLENYIQQVQRQLVYSNDELAHLQKHVMKTQSQLTKKAQEEKTWGNLKQQKQDLFNERNKVAEQNYFDELASARFHRTAQSNLAERW